MGTPLCPACYDYTGAVLFNALAGGLWHRFTDNLSRQLAHATGISRTRLREHVRVSYAKVAEYQHRGAIHFHAIIRLDGPDGPGSTPPPWASLSLLIQAARAAHAAAWVASPDSLAVGSRRLRFGTQLDIRPIHTTDDPDGVSEQAVAGYVAKYVTKGDLPGLISDRPIHHRSTIELLPVSEHARTLMSTCWRLGGLTAFAGLNLRTWAHQLGYRGHIATKSRTYSTTYTALRDARAAWQHARHGSPDQNAETVAVSEWGYAGRGYTTGETMFAANIAHDKAVVRENNAEARTLGLGE